MEGPPLGPGGEDITWPDQVVPRGRKASSTRKIKPQTSNLLARGSGCVCVRVPAPPVPRHSWFRCAAEVCVPALGVRLRPATPGWGVWGCVCVCVRAPLLPRHSWLGLFGVGVCAWARVSVAPRHSWLGCWGLAVFVCPLRLYPPIPGWGVWCGCVCLSSGFSCAPPLLDAVFGCVCFCVRARVLPRHSWLGFVVWVCVLGIEFWLPPATPGLGRWGVAVFVCPLRLYPATPGWGVWCECVCLGSGLGSAPPLLAGVFECVCVFVCALRLYPATPGWGVRCGCVCLGSGFVCAPPLLAGVLGCLCVCVRAPLVPRHSWLGCVVWVCVLGLRFWLRPATPGWGVGLYVCMCVRSACTPPLLPGFCGVWVGCCPAPVPVPWFVACCARCPSLRDLVAVVARHLSACPGCGRRRASLACLAAPRWCAAPRLVRSLSVLWSAFLTPWCLSPSRELTPLDLLGGCAGHVDAGREPGSLCPPLAPAEAGALSSIRVVPVPGPAMGLSLAGPSGVGLGLRALRWLACVDPVTDVSGFSYRSSFDRGLGRCTGAVSCGRRHRPFRVRRRHAQVPRLCDCACCAWPGRAGWPPGRLLVRLTFSCGCFALLLWSAHPGLGCPVGCGGHSFPVCAPLLCPAFRVLRPDVPWALASCSPPLFSFLVFLRRPPLHFFFCSSLVFCSWRFCLFVFSFFPLVRLLFLFFRCPVCCCFFFLPVVHCGVRVCGCGVCWCVVLLALPSVVRCVFCLVLCGVLVLGWVLAPCCPARCCAWFCWAVSFVLCCRVLPCSLLVFFFALFRAFPWWSMLFWSVWCSAVVRFAGWRGPVALFLCWLLLRCTVWCFAVPWCVSWFCAVLFVSLRCLGRVLPRPLLWRVVVLCLSLGAVLCRSAVLLVVRVLSFLVPCFWAPPFLRRLLCGAVLVCRCRCSLCGALSPLLRWLVLCVVAYCVRVFAVGLGCPLLSPGGSWCRVSVVLSLSGRVARRSVV